jgi:aminopeptidase N
MNPKIAVLLLVLFAVASTTSQAQTKTEPAQVQGKRSPEVLRGQVTTERRWWDLLHYSLAINVFPESKSLSGVNLVKFRVVESGSTMQIDLQQPLTIDSVTHRDQPLKFNREGNVYWIRFPQPLNVGDVETVAIAYSGVPTEAKNPPWNGGVAWKKDDKGKPFIATSCQGIGASIWWPCKDHGDDEPDNGMDIRLTVPEELKAVANGRLVEETHNANSKTRTFHWQVTNPINNYAVTMNVGNYVHFADKYEGEFGTLDVDYWVIKGQQERAKAHFKEVPRTLEAFEHWFGKYPFYKDSYKLVVVPYLGMEHQSAVSYGNGFGQGYRGRDLSGTGVGMKFDFIIVHESGHEWFGNSITAKDIADMWIHESFTNYSETLFVDFHFTTAEANDYVIGCRRLIANDKPIVGKYNLHQRGSGTDMYYKGGNMLHMIRQIVNDDDKFRSILRGMNKQFFHETVTSKQIERFMSERAGIDLSSLFDQYLRSTKIPKLVVRHNQKQLRFKFENCNQALTFPVKLLVNGKPVWISPTTVESTKVVEEEILTVQVDRNFYLKSSVVLDTRK